MYYFLYTFILSLWFLLLLKNAWFIICLYCSYTWLDSRLVIFLILAYPMLFLVSRPHLKSKRITDFFGRKEATCLFFFPIYPGCVPKDLSFTSKTSNILTFFWQILIYLEATHLFWPILTSNFYEKDTCLQERPPLKRQAIEVWCENMGCERCPTSMALQGEFDVHSCTLYNSVWSMYSCSLKWMVMLTTEEFWCC